MPPARYLAAPGLLVRSWDGESTALAYLPGTGSSHLISRDALAVLQSAAARQRGLPLADIAHGLGLPIDGDNEVEQALMGIIQGLLQSGLMLQAEDDADPGRKTAA